MVRDRQPELLHRAHRGRADRDHRAAVLHELLDLRQRLRRHLPLPARELLGDRLRREAGAPASSAAPWPPAAPRPPGAPGAAPGAAPRRFASAHRITWRRTAAATAAAAAGLQTGAVEDDHVVLLAQVALVEIRREHAARTGTRSSRGPAASSPTACCCRRRCRTDRCAAARSCDAAPAGARRGGLEADAELGRRLLEDRARRRLRRHVERAAAERPVCQPRDVLARLPAAG